MKSVPLVAQLEQAQEEFDAFNMRLIDDVFPASCKGRLVLELWDDYDKLRQLRLNTLGVDLAAACISEKSF